MSNRKIRISEVINIITNENVSSQEELLKKLNERGLSATQATLSRDLRQINAVKVADSQGNYRYRITPGLNDPEDSTAALSSRSQTAGALSITKTGNLIIIKTRNGYASALAFDIDQLQSPLLLGTIPGADTIFIAVAENASSKALFSLFSTFISEPVMQAAATTFGVAEE